MIDFMRFEKSSGGLSIDTQNSMSNWLIDFKTEFDWLKAANKKNQEETPTTSLETFLNHCF